MSLLVTEAACSNDISWRIFPAIATCLQVLGSGLQKLYLAHRQRVNVRVGRWIGQPHRLIAVKAKALLAVKCMSAQALENRVV